MSEPRPSNVTWSEHGLVKTHLLGYARSDVAYNFPSNDDLTAHVVTLWRRA